MATTVRELKPTNPMVGPLLTDKYEFTMAYGWWRLGMADRHVVVDVHFRHNPFAGQFTVFAGLDEVVRFLADYRFDDERIDLLRGIMGPGIDPGFYDWLRNASPSSVTVRAIREGSLVFPRVPLFLVEGPVAMVQLLETALLTLINYPSLIATSAARIRLAAGASKRLMEFGLRRAPGPDGGISASRYAFLGGFDSTSDVKASALFPEIPASGTHAHTWVQSFLSLDDVRDCKFDDASGKPFDLLARALHYRRELDAEHTNEAEFASFVGYACTYPSEFLALVDTYDTLRSGVQNFLAVALALNEAGWKPVGIRLDSGDLAFLSRRARAMFRSAGDRFGVDFAGLTIVASNDIDESTILSLNQQGHEIDAFGIGTNLVMPGEALGCVYKTVEVAGVPRIKVSSDAAKTTIPNDKRAYRLYDHDGRAVVDLLAMAHEPAPEPNSRVLCRHPFEETTRVVVIPSRIEELHQIVWDGSPRAEALRPLSESRDYVLHQLATFRPDHLRPINPTPYKVSVTPRLYDFVRELLESEVPIAEIR